MENVALMPQRPDVVMEKTPSPKKGKEIIDPRYSTAGKLFSARKKVHSLLSSEISPSRHECVERR